MLADASNKVVYQVTLSFAAAKVAFEKRYGAMEDAVVAAVKATPLDYDDSSDAFVACPVCESRGVAEGDVRLEADGEWDEDAGDGWETVFFTAASSRAPGAVCGSIRSRESAAAGVDEEWDLPDFDASLLL